MHIKRNTFIVFLLLLLAVGGYNKWKQGAPRRESLASLQKLDHALHSGGRAELPELVVIPPNLRNQAAPEQSEFLLKVLADEISPEGLAVLKKDGQYGPLKELFPVEAESWAAQAGVPADECVAFKLERHGLRAEVVLLKPAISTAASRSDGVPHRIVRINNVRQMALPSPVSITENKP